MRTDLYTSAMSQVTLGGNPVNTSGDLPAVGTSAPSFDLAAVDLGNISSADLAGKNVVLNIFPSVDNRDVRHDRSHIQRTRRRSRQHRRSLRICGSAVRPGPILRRRRNCERKDSVELQVKLRRRLRRQPHRWQVQGITRACRRRHRPGRQCQAHRACQRNRPRTELRRCAERTLIDTS